MSNAQDRMVTGPVEQPNAADVPVPHREGQPSPLTDHFLQPDSLRSLRSLAAINHDQGLDAFPSTRDLLNQLEKDKHPNWDKERLGDVGAHAQADTSSKAEQMVKSLKPDELKGIRSFIDTLSSTGDLNELDRIVQSIPTDRRKAFQNGLRLEMERERYEGPYKATHTYYDKETSKIVLNITQDTSPYIRHYELGGKSDK